MDVDAVLSDVYTRIPKAVFYNVSIPSDSTGSFGVNVLQRGKLYVLEVNAQCGISEDEDYTSIGAILRVNGTSFKELILEILQDAFIRNRTKWD